MNRQPGPAGAALPGSRACFELRIVLIAWSLNLALCMVKLAVILFGSSRTLLVDMLPPLINLSVTCIVLTIVGLTARDPGEQHPFGRQEWEILSSHSVRILILAASVAFVGYSIDDMVAAGTLKTPGLLTVAGAVVSILFIEMISRVGRCSGEKLGSRALFASAWATANQADILTSCAFIAAVVGVNLNQLWRREGRGAATHAPKAAPCGAQDSGAPRDIRGRARALGRCIQCSWKVAWVSLCDSLLIAALKGVIGTLSSSRALTMSALYSLQDASSALLLIMRMGAPGKPGERPKSELAVSLGVNLGMMATAVCLAWGAFRMLADPGRADAHWAAIGAVLVSLIANECINGYNLCSYRQFGNPAILVHAKNHRADTLSSLLVLAALAGSKMGYTFLDPLAAALQAAHLLAANGLLAYQAMADLLVRAWGRGIAVPLQEDAADG